jgi:transcriptional antiterminator RfaH
MSQIQTSPPWFALHVRMHDHGRVETALHHKGYDVFAPTYLTTRVAAGRERPVQKPLFPGYLFCSLDPQYRLPVLTVPGVIRILGLGTSVTPVPTDEIESIRRTVNSGLPFEPFRLLEPGELVEVQSGPLAGIKGVVVYHKGKYRVVVTVTALNDRAVSVEVDRAAIARADGSDSALVPLPVRKEECSPLQWQQQALLPLQQMSVRAR